jgi:glyoxylase-like metal-dependent hydrolase (beta-lactamase superfamily II)
MASKLGIIFSVALLASPVSAQLTRTAEIKDIPLRNNVHMFMGAGGNIGVTAGADGAAVIDTQFAEQVDRIIAAVKKLDARPIGYVLNTHWHFDHTGGNEGLGKIGATIVAHENTFKCMSTRSVIGAMNMTFEPSPRVALPTITVRDTGTVHLNGHTIEIVSLPAAHTDTDVMYVFKEANVVHTGDVYTRVSYPFVDTSSGGTIKGMIAARRKILTYLNADTQVIPGHGDLSTMKELADTIPMLEAVEARVAALVKAGKTLEQTLAEKPTKDFDAIYAPRPDQGDVFVTRLYNEMTGK